MGLVAIVDEDGIQIRPGLLSPTQLPSFVPVALSSLSAGSGPTPAKDRLLPAPPPLGRKCAGLQVLQRPTSTPPQVLPTGGEGRWANKGKISPSHPPWQPHTPPLTLFPETEDSCYASGGMALCSLGDFAVN